MKKLLIALGALGLLATSLAFNVGGIAQTLQIPYVATLGQNDIMQVVPNASPQVGNRYATLTQLRAWLLGGASGHSATPVVSACGTSPAVVGSDFAARLTTGTATPVSCTLTFAAAFTNIPTCSVTSQTAYATSTPSYTVSATAIVITQAATDSNIYNVICVARNGG